MALKILWVSNSPHVSVSYGTQTRTITPRLKALGHEITILAFYGLQGGPMTFNGMAVMPCGMNDYANDVLVADAQHFGVDVVISLMDVWVLAQEVTGQVRWYPHLPVDHEPCPPPVVDSLRTAVRPIAMSQFGARMLRAAGYDPYTVPLGADGTIFKPLDRAACRVELGFGADEFVVGMVQANKGAPSRKAFDQQIRAFARFRQRHADAVLYLHTDMLGTQGENLRRIIELADLPRGAVVEVPSYRYARGLINDEWMAKAYNSFDVLLAATRAEGFGLPIVEAQLCGTPAIVTDFSSMPELIPDGLGWKVGWSDKVFYQDAYQVIPDVAEIEQALEQAYRVRDNQDLRNQVAQAAQVYDADEVTKTYWKPVLEDIERCEREADEALSDSRRRRREKREGLRHGQRAEV